jgi:TolB-like protein/DNA-binding winged helix-turn-helix (wHTH) protein/Flp pilus assembly protein TadD
MGEALGINLLQRVPGPRPEAEGDAPLREGEWRVEVRANEIWRGAEKVKLEPKVMQVLCFLAQRPGSVVSREELEAAAWPRMVVTTDAVTGTIIKLRKALGDDARHPRYIETVSKSGYRLIAEVGRGSTAAPASPPSAQPRRRPLAPLLLILVLVAAGGIWLLLRDGEPPASGPIASTYYLDQKPGIAVLPFENLGPAPEQDYFADGITEDLTTDLSKLSGLRVVARDSALTYKDSREDARRIAEQLGVDYLLKGSVQRFAGRVRINARLIDGKRGGNLWAERYDRQIEDIFRIQDEIAERIVAALAVEIAASDRSRLASDRLASVPAYDAFLQGLDHYGRRSKEDSRLAIQHYRRAIAIDPGFARAYAGLGLVYFRDVADGWDLAARDALTQAEELTEKAKRLDPSVPQIYFVDGQIELFRRNYEAAIRNTEHALSIKPSYADAHVLLAWILHFAGRPEEGLASMERGVRLNPRVPAVYRLVRGALYYSMEDYEHALADLEPAAEVSPSYQLLRLWLAAAYAGAGRLEDARWEAQEILALDPEFTIAQVEQSLPIREAAYRERLLRDLRRTGLPN